MCYIITHVLEFNNWRAFVQMYDFACEIYGEQYPEFEIQVPLCIGANGWDMLDRTFGALMKKAPENLEEMSIYGKIWFQVTKDYSQNPYESES